MVESVVGSAAAISGSWAAAGLTNVTGSRASENRVATKQVRSNEIAS